MNSRGAEKGVSDSRFTITLRGKVVYVNVLQRLVVSYFVSAYLCGPSVSLRVIVFRFFTAEAQRTSELTQRDRQIKKLVYEVDSLYASFNFRKW